MTEAQSSSPNRGSTDLDLDLALSRGVLYRALALGFQPPSDETIARLASSEGVAALTAAAACLDSAAGGDLTASVSLLAPRSSLPALTEAYRRLFGHTARGVVSPYETEYGAEALFQQPQELADLAGFYRAFGLAPNGEAHERPDHISCECEFLAFLAVKEAYALERGESAMREETAKAARLFLRDHLGRFVPAFAKRVIEASGGGLYAALADFCRRFVAMECRRVGVAPGPPNLGLRPPDDDRVPMACGAEACPIGAAARQETG